MKQQSNALQAKLPADFRREQAIKHTLQTQLDRFGYTQIDTPLIEPAEEFLVKAGDAAINRLLSFDLPGKTFCLRPEFTVPAANVYINHFQEHTGAARFQFCGPVIKYRNLSHGQIQQQEAIGAELINENTPAADAEVIALAANMLNEVLPAWQCTVGHSGFIERFLDRYDLNRQMRRFVLAWLPYIRSGETGLNKAREALAEVSPAIKPENTLVKMDEESTSIALQALLQATPQRGSSGSRTREEIALRLLEKRQYADQHANAMQALTDLEALYSKSPTLQTLKKNVVSPELVQAVEQIEETFALLEAYGVQMNRVRFDLGFTRNLDYYTGIVFEFTGTILEQPHTLGGGGRYDDLIELLGGHKSTPAVGFMLYLEPLMKTPQKSTNQHAAILLSKANSIPTAELLQLAGTLREKDYNVTTAFEGQSDFSAFTHHINIDSPSSLALTALANNDTQNINRDDLDALTTLLEKSA